VQAKYAAINYRVVDVEYNMCCLLSKAYLPRYDADRAGATEIKLSIRDVFRMYCVSSVTNDRGPTSNLHPLFFVIPDDSRYNAAEVITQHL
jgi:hypothetical protein